MVEQMSAMRDEHFHSMHLRFENFPLHQPQIPSNTTGVLLGRRSAADLVFTLDGDAQFVKRQGNQERAGESFVSRGGTGGRNSVWSSQPGFSFLMAKLMPAKFAPWIFLVAKRLEFPHCYFTIKKAQTMKIKYFAASLFIIHLCFGLRADAGETPDKNCFNVRSFGAQGDGKNLDSPAIDKAIDAAAEAGGGTVLVPAGTYLSGSIHLKSNIHLLIDAGATILGAPQKLNAYDFTEPWTNNPYQDGGHCYFHNSLIWGENLTNVFIT